MKTKRPQPLSQSRRCTRRNRTQTDLSSFLQDGLGLLLRFRAGGLLPFLLANDAVLDALGDLLINLQLPNLHLPLVNFLRWWRPHNL